MSLLPHRTLLESERLPRLARLPNRPLAAPNPGTGTIIAKGAGVRPYKRGHGQKIFGRHFLVGAWGLLALAAIMILSSPAWAQEQIPISSGAVTVPVSHGKNYFWVLLNQNVTRFAIAGAPPSTTDRIMVLFVQDSNGGKTVAGYASNIVNSRAILVNTDPNAPTTLAFQYDSSSNRWIVVAGFSSPILGPVTDKGGQVFNVKAYGAVGKGTTDDTAAIQAALNAAAPEGGTVYFPQGIYIANGLIYNGKGVVLQGAGTPEGGNGTEGGSTVLECTASGQWVITIGSISAATFHGPEINNIEFKDGAAGSCTGGVKIINASYPLLVNDAYTGFSSIGVSAPAAPSIRAGTAGSMATSTYYVKVSYNTPSGESLPSSASSISVTGPSGSIRVTSPAASGSAVSYNVYMHGSTGGYALQDLSGPTPIGTNATIKTYDTSVVRPVTYNESGGAGLMLYGSYGGYGQSDAYLNQPTVINQLVKTDVYNGIVADRAITGLGISGGDFDLGTPGCSVIVGSYSRIDTHFESSSSATGPEGCFEGNSGTVHSSFETGSSSDYGFQLYRAQGWDIHFVCGSFASGHAANITPYSLYNTIWAENPNGSCREPVVSDRGSNNTVLDSSASGYFQFGSLVSLSPTAVSALPPASSYPGAMVRVSNSTTISSEGQACAGGGSATALAFSNGSAWKCF